MKHLLIIFLGLLLYSNCLYAQCTRLEFTYDDAGNRTARHIVNIACRLESEDSDTVKTILDDKKILLFPNPIKEILNVHFKGKWKFENTQLQVFDLNGKVLLTEKNINSEKEIQFSEFPTGAYILYVISEEKKYEYKIIKE